MRVVSMSFSITGNTALALEHVCRSLDGVECVETTDEEDILDVSGFDGVVLAAPTFYRGLPPPFARRVSKITGGRGQPTLVLATYGAMLGRTLVDLVDLAEKASLRVVAAQALLMPESYPPFIAKGWSNTKAPVPGDLAKLNTNAQTLLKALRGSSQPAVSVSAGFFDRLLGRPSRQKSVKRLGGLICNKTLCSRCGQCREACPVQAIRWESGPVFDRSECIACFGCYNRCPTGAIDAGCMKRRDGRYRPETIGLASRFE